MVNPALIHTNIDQFMAYLKSIGYDRETAILIVMRAIDKAFSKEVSQPNTFA